MEKLIGALLIVALALGCKDKDCPAGFSGEDCTTELTPKRVDLVSLSAAVTSTGWDDVPAVTPPDLYFVVESSAHDVLLETPVCADANTCAWNGALSFGANETCILRVFDEDNAGFREQIGAFNLVLYQNGGGFPTSISGTLSGLTVTVGLAYAH